MSARAARAAGLLALLALLALAGSAAGPAAARGQARPGVPAGRAPRPIADNSLLVEEAYNQEERVVQHISLLSLQARGGGWSYTLTQEWPLGGPRHQASYTLPVEDPGSGRAGPGDVALHYRYQLVGGPEARVAVAPRLSLLLPTGGSRGRGAPGIQAAVPATTALGRAFVAHWNAGVTHTPRARDGGEAEASATDFHLAHSLVWLVRPARFNLLLEVAWERVAEVQAPGRTAGREALFVAPGLRAAFEAGSVQVVPAAGLALGVGPSRGERLLLAYLSLEHPF